MPCGFMIGIHIDCWLIIEGQGEAASESWAEIAGEALAPIEIGWRKRGSDREGVGWSPRETR
jgi:hypothetical protein